MMYKINYVYWPLQPRIMQHNCNYTVPRNPLAACVRMSKEMTATYASFKRRTAYRRKEKEFYYY